MLSVFRLENAGDFSLKLEVSRIDSTGPIQDTRQVCNFLSFQETSEEDYLFSQNEHSPRKTIKAIITSAHLYVVAFSIKNWMCTNTKHQKIKCRIHWKIQCLIEQTNSLETKPIFTSFLGMKQWLIMPKMPF